MKLNTIKYGFSLLNSEENGYTLNFTNNVSISRKEVYLVHICLTKNENNSDALLLRSHDYSTLLPM